MKLNFFSSILVLTLFYGSANNLVLAEDTWGSSSSSTNATTGDCSPSVQNQIASYQRSSIDDARVLASQLYTSVGSDYGQLSCLDNILKSGLSSFFNQGSLGSMLQSVVNSVCNMGTSMLQNAVSPLAQNISGAIPTGNIVPGLSLGALSGGIGVNPHIGGNGSNVSVSGSYLGFPGTQIPSYNLNSMSTPLQAPTNIFPDSWKTPGTYSTGLTGSGSWW